MKGLLNFNGSFSEESKPLITAENRGFKYGDGIFETMRAVFGKLMLKELHFERLFRGAKLLDIQMPANVTAEYLEEQVIRTVEKNKIKGAARVRLMVFRGEGGLQDSSVKGNFIIQVWPIPSSKLGLNENGMIVGLYKEARKSCDILSSVKSNNYLLFILASIYAKKNRFNDSLILNVHGRICESTIANVFWVKNGNLFTPPLSEGCVAGVMRAHLINTLGVTEKECTVEELESADELFLSNAVKGIRWVKEFNGKTYQNTVCKKVFESTI